MQPQQPSYTYATFWQRFLAHVIDMLIVNFVTAIPLILIILVLMGFSAGSSGSGRSSGNAVLGSLFILVLIIYAFLSMLAPLLYWSYMESSKYKATFGKRICGLIVTDENGYKLTFTGALVRNLCKYISNMTFYVGYIMAAFTEKHQALHDIIAKTVVLKKV